MFIAHNCSDKWGFNVFGKKPKKEVANLIKIIKSGKYEDLIKEAMENYRQTQEKQIKGWAVLLKLLGIKKVATAEPGIGYFFGPVDQTLEILGLMFGKFGGKDLERFCYKYDGKFDEVKVRNYYKRGKEDNESNAVISEEQKG